MHRVGSLQKGYYRGKDAVIDEGTCACPRVDRARFGAGWSQETSNRPCAWNDGDPSSDAADRAGAWHDRRAKASRSAPHGPALRYSCDA